MLDIIARKVGFKHSVLNVQKECTVRQALALLHLCANKATTVLLGLINSSSVLMESTVKE